VIFLIPISKPKNALGLWLWRMLGSLWICCLLCGAVSAWPVPAMAAPEGEVEPALPGETALLLGGADAPALDSESAILAAADSGEILYAKNPRKRMYPASVTKLMTLFLGTEAVRQGAAQWEEPVTASSRAASYGGSQIYLAPGEIMSYREIMLGIALASGNDAAVALAEHLAGSHESFAERMNQRAKELGMEDTHFVNANGLHDPEHYTTAYDLSLLAAEAAKLPELLELSSAKHYTLRADTSKPFQLDNKNKLLWQLSGVDGFKTGWTQDAGYCLAATGKQETLRLISVVMGNPKARGHIADSKKLLEWGFRRFTFEKLFDAGDVVARIKVGKGMQALVPVRTESAVGYAALRTVPREAAAQWEIAEEVPAPIREGQVLGHLVLRDGEAALGRYPLYASEGVEKETVGHGLVKLLSFFLG
jgi:D-alanyl-D-alanine carboxypeptidase (penicillin-binding protein 5/6)